MEKDEELVVYHSDPKSFSLKNDTELFDEEKQKKINQLVSARHIFLSKGEEWQIWENDQLMLRLSGARFSKKERFFLQSVEGMRFLVAQFKAGVRVVSQIKGNLPK